MRTLRKSIEFFGWLCIIDLIWQYAEVQIYGQPIYREIDLVMASLAAFTLSLITGS